MRLPFLTMCAMASIPEPNIGFIDTRALVAHNFHHRLMKFLAHHAFRPQCTFYKVSNCHGSHKRSLQARKCLTRFEIYRLLFEIYMLVSERHLIQMLTNCGHGTETGKQESATSHDIEAWLQEASQSVSYLNVMCFCKFWGKTNRTQKTLCQDRFTILPWGICFHQQYQGEKCYLSVRLLTSLACSPFSSVAPSWSTAWPPMPCM